MAPQPQPSTTDVRQGYADLEAAALFLGVSQRTIRRMISRGQLRGYRYGQLVRVKWSDLDDVMQPIPAAAAGS